MSKCHLGRVMVWVTESLFRSGAGTGDHGCADGSCKAGPAVTCVDSRCLQERGWSGFSTLELLVWEPLGRSEGGPQSPCLPGSCLSCPRTQTASLGTVTWTATMSAVTPLLPEQALLSVHLEQTSSHVFDGYTRTLRSETSLRVSLPLDLNKVASLL